MCQFPFLFQINVLLDSYIFLVVCIVFALFNQVCLIICLYCNGTSTICGSTIEPKLGQNDQTVTLQGQCGFLSFFLFRAFTAAVMTAALKSALVFLSVFILALNAWSAWTAVWLCFSFVCFVSYCGGTDYCDVKYLFQCLCEKIFLNYLNE